MKLTAAKTPSPFRGTLNKSNKVYLTILSIIIASLWNTHSVTTAPAKTDSLDSTFPLDLQPPIFEASAATASAFQTNGDSEGTTTVDSYGNPIESLQPIETPDGRKVVSAQGLQFEIPTYASGITELKKPADDLLPPFVGELRKFRTANSLNDVGLRGQEQVKAKAGLLRDVKRTKRQLEDIFNTTTTATTTKNTNLYNNNNNKNNNDNNLKTTLAQPQDEVSKAQNTKTKVANTTPKNNTNPPELTDDTKSHTNINSTFSETLLSSQNVASSLSLFVRNQSRNRNLNTSTIKSPTSTPLPIASSFTSSPSLSLPYNKSFQSRSYRAKLSAHYTPLSNGNFNYPNIPTDTSIIERLHSKYINHTLPTLDPIVVALPTETDSSTSSLPSFSSSSETTSVDVESVPLMEVKTQATGVSPEFQTLPDYILEFNDPDIGGPVEYTPSFDNRGLSVIAWDLLPPLEAEPELDGNNKAFSQKNQVSVTTGHNVNDYNSKESSQTTFTSRFGTTTTTTTTTTTPRTTTSTTRRTTTTTTTPRPTTTTTRRTTTTPRTTTTTTRRSTTPRTTTTTTPRTTTTTEAPDSSEFYKLENGDSYTLPSWLEDIDDPELDVAVAYNIPEDINEYNHTIDRNILPPLEPYTDLNNIKLTPPTTLKEDATTTPRTTTTRWTTTPRTTAKTTTTKPPTYTSRQPNWIRAKPTVAKTTIASFNKQLTSLTPTISSFNIAQRTTGTTISTTTATSSTTTTTTTVKPKTTVNYYNQQFFTSTTPRTDKIGSSQEETFNANPKNPFLPTFNDGKYRPKPTTPRTTTTTTTKAPEIVEKNPFEPTLPPWLKDFDYPDVGPGVPFVYDPNEDESSVDENILPPSQNFDDNSNTNNNQASLTSSSASAKTPFSNSQIPQGFTTKFTSSATTSLTSSSSIPSIVTLPLPSTQTATSNQDVTQPPLVFVPPTSLPNSEEGLSKTSSSTIFIKNIPAPFEPASTASSATASTDDQKKPLGADRESFPPFNNVISGSSFSTTLPTKTTFTKSEDGKVITNNIFLSGSFGSTTPKSFVSGQSQEKDISNSATFSGSSVFKQIATTSAAASGFTTASSSSGTTFGNNDSKYTGRFGGPPGVLAPGSGAAFNAGSSTVTKSYNKPAATAGSSTNKDKFTGSFGGPPGVLKPYDNVKSR